MLQVMNDIGNELRINDGLNLQLITSGDVREKPNRFLQTDRSLLNQQRVRAPDKTWRRDVR